MGQIRSVWAGLTAAVVMAGMAGVAVPAARADTSPVAGLSQARAAAPVVLNGSQIPGWAEPAATGVAAPYPYGTSKEPDEPDIPGSGLRSAHNGTLTVPPDNPAITPVDPQTAAAYRWTGSAWKEIPVQVDKMFLDFLANGRSSFGIYSGTDPELVYAWGQDAHDNGLESWKRLFGTCDARLATSLAEVQSAISAGYLTPGLGETAASYLSSMQDPQSAFDTDDQLSFMAGDAGAAAPTGQAAPAGTADGQTVTVTDPLDPTSVSYVYLFTKPGGSSFNASNGYVHMAPNADADQWIDRATYGADSPNAIGTSNTGYGPNIPAQVCRTAVGPTDATKVDDQATAPRASTDANPRDGFTITTPTYEIDTRGRWLVNGLHVTAPGTTGQYGPNIIGRWKGRAFQQTPDASISVVGFEDEQVNWEMNSSLLGWRQGPVRAMREIWGADSGTNVTKTEIYYRDADIFNYHLRVHPIPPDGLYTDWDYRPGVATTYYNLKSAAGVPIDGQPDTVGDIDSVAGQNESIATCDPTAQICSALDSPEEIAGNGFGLVYEFELTSQTAATGGNVAILPYYRDDACFDDGTGDAPAPRAQPGEKSTDPRTEAGYLAYWQGYWDANPSQRKGTLRPASYADLVCNPSLAVGGDPTANPTVPPWKIMPFQGAIAEHGIHFLFTQDSDNAFSPANIDEVDGQQWRFEVPMATPSNVLIPYGANVSTKLVPVVTPFLASATAATSLPESPLAALLPVVGIGLGAGLLMRRRRRRQAPVS